MAGESAHEPARAKIKDRNVLVLPAQGDTAKCQCPGRYHYSVVWWRTFHRTRAHGQGRSGSHSTCRRVGPSRPSHTPCPSGSTAALLLGVSHHLRYAHMLGSKSTCSVPRACDEPIFVKTEAGHSAVVPSDRVQVAARLQFPGYFCSTSMGQRRCSEERCLLSVVATRS